MKPCGVLVLPETALNGCDELGSLWKLKLGGVAFILRQARLLRAAGIEEIYIAGTSQDAALLDVVRGGHLGLDQVGFIDRLEMKASVEGDQQGSFSGKRMMLLLRADWLFEKTSIKRVAEQTSPSYAPKSFTYQDKIAGIVITGPEQIGAALAILDKAGQPAEKLANESSHSKLSANDVIGIVESADQLPAYEHQLWETCRKSVDGIISRNFNRRISIAISKRIAVFPISPNQISLFNLLLGILAALFAAQGDYWSVLAGAGIFKLNSILDGVDGELARIRFQSSVLGEWLDTLSDDASNLMFFIGLGWGTWAQTGNEIWLWLTVMMAIPTLAVALNYYRQLIRIGRGDILAMPWFQSENNNSSMESSLKGQLLSFGAQIFRKDMLVSFVLLCSVFGLSSYCLIIVMVSAWIVLIAQIKLSMSHARGAS